MSYYDSIYENIISWGGGETVETFFSLWMWHHAGRPTTDHCAETIGINCYSPREADDFTQTLDKYEIKA